MEGVPLEQCQTRLSIKAALKLDGLKTDRVPLDGQAPLLGRSDVVMHQRSQVEHQRAERACIGQIA